MSNLKTYLKTSKIHIVKVTYGGETITFNLGKELRISESRLNDELKVQPSKYGFALMLLGKLKTRFEDLKTTRREVRGRLWKKAKNTIQETTKRPMSDELAKAWVESHPKFITAERACTMAKDDVDVMYAVVRAFEQRKDVIQTISSNIRNEK
jgi:hypothetical protein